MRKKELGTLLRSWNVSVGTLSITTWVPPYLREGRCLHGRYLWNSNSPKQSRWIKSITYKNINVFMLLGGTVPSKLWHFFFHHPLTIWWNTENLWVLIVFFCCTEYVEFWSRGNLHQLYNCGSVWWEGDYFCLPFSVSVLSQLHTEPCYNYPNNHSIHTERTWLTSPPATGRATRGNLTGIQPVHSTTFT